MNKLLLTVLIFLIALSGCAMVETIKPKDVLKNPLGSDSLKRGMSKDEVLSLWGEPDAVLPAGSSNDALHTAREEWVYNARYSRAPLKKDYFGKSQRLYFDGDNLTGWKADR